MRYARKEPLRKHTSFRIGGPAEYFCVAKSVNDLKEAILFAKERKLQITILGAGTNLLVLDWGFNGLVIKLGLNWVKTKDSKVAVGAGVPLAKLIRTLSQKGLGGLEFLAGIPGTVGGAVVMNAGAWKKEIGKYVHQVAVLDKEGKEIILKRKNLGFGYRQSRLQGKSWIVTEVHLKLHKKKKTAITKSIREHLVKRKSVQPLGSPNSGSIFKNPKGDFAGRIIEEAGCKGMRVGDAQVSCKHANFIVNLGDAKAKDVISLMTAIRKMVKEKLKIELEPEIKIMVKSPS